MDAPRDYEALKTVDFIVNADPILTPLSAAVADVLLPVAMSCERNSARTWWTPVRTMYRAVEPAGEAKTDERDRPWTSCRASTRKLRRVLLAGRRTPLHRRLGTLAGGDGKKHGASSNVKGNISEKAKGGCGISFKELSEKGGFAYDDWNHTYEKHAQGPAARRREPRFRHAFRPRRAGALHVPRLGPHAHAVPVSRASPKAP